jgi:uncharacterized protein
MGKVFVWLAIGVVAWLAWRLVVASRRRAAGTSDPAADSGAGAAAPGPDEAPDRPATPELMMQCAVCGIHLPGSEARFAGGRVYCSDTHRDQGAAVREDEAVRRDRR